MERNYTTFFDFDLTFVISTAKDCFFNNMKLLIHEFMGSLNV